MPCLTFPVVPHAEVKNKVSLSYMRMKPVITKNLESVQVFEIQVVEYPTLPRAKSTFQASRNLAKMTSSFRNNDVHISTSFLWADILCPKCRNEG
jgi:hypothetical protein